MGAVMGVVIGYSLGTRAGEQGWAELTEAWREICASPEVRDLLSGGFATARELLGRSGGLLAGALGSENAERVLRRVA